MIKTRIAATTALFTFGLAAIGGTALAAAAPGNAAPSGPGTTSSSSSASTPSGTGSSNGPTSKVGSAPTSNVSSSGGAQTSSTVPGYLSAIGDAGNEAAARDALRKVSEAQQQAALEAAQRSKMAQVIGTGGDTAATVFNIILDVFGG